MYKVLKVSQIYDYVPIVLYFCFITLLTYCLHATITVLPDYPVLLASLHFLPAFNSCHNGSRVQAVHSA
jgi:hypothetical protein